MSESNSFGYGARDEGLGMNIGWGESVNDVRCYCLRLRSVLRQMVRDVRVRKDCLLRQSTACWVWFCTRT